MNQKTLVCPECGSTEVQSVVQPQDAVDNGSRATSGYLEAVGLTPHPTLPGIALMKKPAVLDVQPIVLIRDVIMLINAHVMRECPIGVMTMLSVRDVLTSAVEQLTAEQTKQHAGPDGQHSPVG